MQINDDQKSQVAQWVADGADLAEVQKRLKSEWDISMTYMDTRFLIDDLQLVIADKEEEVAEPEPEPAPPAPAKAPAPGTESAPAPQPGTAPAGDDGVASNVTVSIDQITRPDAMISGGVTFSDGIAAKWQIDQMGRLALDPDQPDYRPTDADVAAFQNELRKLAQSQGL